MTRLDTLLAWHADDPDDSFVRFAIASEFRKLGRPEDAARMLESLREHDPGYVGTYYHLGGLYRELGRDRDAAAIYRAGIEVAASDAHARSELEAALMDIDAG